MYCIPLGRLQERQLFGDRGVDAHQLPQVVERHAQTDSEAEPLHHLQKRREKHQLHVGMKPREWLSCRRAWE